MLDRTPLSERARGRWRSILPMFGVDTKTLDGKQHPCPICGGRDRFRFDDKAGEGTWYCNQCGAGHGASLVMRKHGLDFAAAAREIEKHLDSAPVARPKPEPSLAQIRRAMNDLWASGGPITAESPAGLYLTRRIGEWQPMRALRAVARMRYHDSPPSWHPGMLAMVSDADGTPVNLHRTYLTADGRKSDVPSPRRMMPGLLPKGAAIRLSEPAERLGIAEGIETALAAQKLFGVPCWAAVSAPGLEAWIPPPETREVVVFGDHDKKFGGQAAAYRLAHRLACDERRAVSVDVRIPDRDGADWADVLLERV